jgi:transcriptional regulator with XRE-family HTH domain
MHLRSRDTLIVCLEATGMSERQLARVAALGHATVNHLVTGRRTRCSLATARAIEAALGCAAGTLFEETDLEDARWDRLPEPDRHRKPMMA